MADCLAPGKTSPSLRMPRISNPPGSSSHAFSRWIALTKKSWKELHERALNAEERKMFAPNPRR